ncbi:TraB/GumN family protein, partial [Pseudomonas marginalis]
MAKLLDGVKRWFRQQATPHYPYPAMDIDISADLSLHLVGSIHMGSENMAPLPQPLLDKLAAADALIVEADVTDNRSPFRPNSDI